MDEHGRRSLHQLIARAIENDAQARAGVEEMIISLDRSGSADDLAQALQMLRILGPDELIKVSSRSCRKTIIGIASSTR